MRKSIRAALIGAAGFAALAFAGSALASFAPKLVVGPASLTTSSSATRIGAVVGASDDPTAETQIFIPAGYSIGSPAAGTQLGAVTATAAAADLGGAILPLTGTVQAIDPSTLTPGGKTAQGACSQNGTPTQTWDLHLSAAGQTLDVPIFVIPGSAPVVASGYQAELCIFLPPPDVPTSNPNRATFGAKLLSATFTVNAITQPASSGSYRWTSLWTPYTPGQGTPNPSGTVETQSVFGTPTAAKLVVTRKRVVKTTTKKVHGKKHTIKTVHTVVKFSTKVTQAGATVTPTAVVTLAGKKKVGGASGSFTMTTKSIVLATAATVHHSASVPTGTPVAATDLFYADLGASACTGTTIFAGRPCIDATSGATLGASGVVVKAYTK